MFRKVFSFTWRVAILAFAFWLLHRVIAATGADIKQDILRSDKLLLTLAFLAYGIVQVFNTLRWQLLLNALEMRTTFWDAFRLVLSGAFFNQLLPGAISGDLIKIGLVAPHFPTKKTEITLTIFLDRVIGLTGLLCAATLAVIVGYKQVWSLGNDAPGIFLAVKMILALTAGLFLAAVIFYFKPWITSLSVVQGLLDFSMRHLPRFVLEIFTRFDTALEMYRKKMWILGGHLLYSLGIHLLCALSFFLIGKALHETHVSLAQYTLTTQLANASSCIPITPAGLGLRDSIAATCFLHFGINPAEVAGSIPIIFTIIMFAWALCGSLALMSLPKIPQNLK